MQEHGRRTLGARVAAIVCHKSTTMALLQCGEARPQCRAVVFAVLVQLIDRLGQRSLEDVVGKEAGNSVLGAREGRRSRFSRSESSTLVARESGGGVSSCGHRQRRPFGPERGVERHECQN